MGSILKSRLPIGRRKPHQFLDYNRSFFYVFFCSNFYRHNTHIEKYPNRGGRYEVKLACLMLSLTM